LKIVLFVDYSGDFQGCLPYATVQAKGALSPVYKLNISMTVLILCKFITIVSYGNQMWKQVTIQNLFFA
jgi:hypothetical protein